MAERVRGIDIGVVWEPNAPDATLLSRDTGATALALNPKSDDEDQRAVVLCWSGALHTSMGGPNDESIPGHRLYEQGLKDVPWIAEVLDSQLIACLERQNRVHPYHRPAEYADLVHYVVLTKEATVEVVARSIAVLRIGNDTIGAAAAALTAAALTAANEREVEITRSTMIDS